MSAEAPDQTAGPMMATGPMPGIGALEHLRAPVPPLAKAAGFVVCSLPEELEINSQGFPEPRAEPKEALSPAPSGQSPRQITGPGQKAACGRGGTELHE